jgi:hypothetical protein
LYLLDRDHLGGYDGKRDHALQELGVTRREILGGPVWLDDGTRQRMFLWPEETNLTALTLGDDAKGSYLKASDVSKVPSTSGTPGGFLSLSANGNQGAIVWATHPWSPDGNGPASAIENIVPGVLRAFDANDLSHELWNNRADAAAPSASVGGFAKFCPPTIANGRVYLAAWRPDAAATGAVIVFGRLH